MWIKDQALNVDRITAVSKQLIEFIMSEILDPRDEFYHDDHINRQSVSTSWGLSTGNRDKMMASLNF